MGVEFINEMGWSETEMPGAGSNLTAGMNPFCICDDSVYPCAPLDKRILDSDCPGRPPPGDQTGSAFPAVVLRPSSRSREISVLQGESVFSFAFGIAVSCESFAAVPGQKRPFGVWPLLAQGV